MYGADLRSCIRAGAGRTLLVSDLAQIEARCAAWLAGETEMLEMAEQGMDWDEANEPLMSVCYVWKQVCFHNGC